MLEIIICARRREWGVCVGMMNLGAHLPPRDVSLLRETRKRIRRWASTSCSRFLYLIKTMSSFPFPPDVLIRFFYDDSVRKFSTRVAAPDPSLRSREASANLFLAFQWKRFCLKIHDAFLRWCFDSWKKIHFLCVFTLARSLVWSEICCCGSCCASNKSFMFSLLRFLRRHFWVLSFPTSWGEKKISAFFEKLKNYNSIW